MVNLIELDDWTFVLNSHITSPLLGHLKDKKQSYKTTTVNKAKSLIIPWAIGIQELNNLRSNFRYIGGNLPAELDTVLQPNVWDFKILLHSSTLQSESFSIYTLAEIWTLFGITTTT